MQTTTSVPSSSSNAATPMSPSSTSVGDVVGGIIGALIAIGLLTVAILRYRKQHKTPKNIERDENGQADIAVIEPFTTQTILRDPPNIEVTVATGPQAPATRLTPNGHSSRFPPKAQEHLEDRQQQNAGHSFAGLTSDPPRADTSRPNFTTERSPERRSGTRARLLSPEEVNDLRTEVRNLRRDLQALQPKPPQPPPSYASEPLPGYPASMSGPVTSTSSRQ